MHIRKPLGGVIAALAIGAGFSQAGDPVSRSFTYQGQLKEGGAPASGFYDFEFRLFDLAAGGAQQGAMVPKNDVLVESGLIKVDLDFGGVFDGNRRWLEVRVRPGASAGAFTPLSSRQELTAAPYALYALGPWQTAGANIFNTTAGNVGIGTTTPASPLHLSGTAQIMEKVATSHTAGTWLELENTSTGGKRWGLISAGSANGEGAGKMLLRAITDGRTVMTLQGDGKVGVGVSNPSNRLSVSGSADFSGNVAIGVAFASAPLHVQASAADEAIRAINTAPFGFTTGVFGRSLSTTGIGVHGAGASYGVFGEGTDTGVFGRTGNLNGISYGVRGLGSSSEGYDFYAEGPGVNYGASSSIRWKRNIKGIENPLERISRLRGVYFDWDAEHGGHHDVGMIAEEVGAVLPEIVNYEQNGVDAHGMDYSKLAPLLVEALRELRAEKSAELAELRRQKDEQIAELAERLARLEALIKETGERLPPSQGGIQGGVPATGGNP